MSRRYLTLDEVKSALNRGKEVEAFLGGFMNDERECIRWATFSKTDEGIIGKIWESFDEGAADFLDVYSFSPVNGEWEEPVRFAHESSIELVTEELGIPECKMVNAGVVQDEYALYKA